MSEPQTGWICPVCGNGVAPSEKQCPHGSKAQELNPPHYPSPNYPPAIPTPVIPYQIGQLLGCGCPIGLVCGRTYCPRRVVMQSSIETIELGASDGSQTIGRAR